MNKNLGKKFEAQFKKDILRLPDVWLYRINDQMSGYFGSSRNICDFLVFKEPYLYLIEVKSHKGNTFPFSAFSQFIKLENEYNKKIKGIKIGVVLWFIEHQEIVYIPIETFIKLKKENKKSFNIKMIDDNNYPCIKVPTTLKRIFLGADYSVIFNN